MSAGAVVGTEVDGAAHDHGHAHEHGVGHDHAHEGDHDHGHLEGYHVHGGAPALDIGGDIGAMVVTLDRDHLGTELHLRSTHQPPLSVHTGVWERDLGDGKVVAAVFAELVEGGYEVLDQDGRATTSVVIDGGRVTTLDLRAS